jgi:hypothetical protein
MGMVIALIALAVRLMNRHICRHSIALDKLRGEGPRNVDPRGVRQLGRQGQLPFAGGHGVGPGLARLGGIPDRSTVLR